MFDNIGGKIKTLAKVLCVLGIIGSVIIAIALFDANSRYESTIGAGLAWLIAGPLASWLSCLTLYGFGELVENNAIIRKALTNYQQISSNIASVKQDEANWICPKCGTSNPHYIGRCPNCDSYNE